MSAFAGGARRAGAGFDKRLDAQRSSLTADGLVGVRYGQSEEPEHEERDLVVTLHVSGTAIARTKTTPPSAPVARVVALDRARPE